MNFDSSKPKNRRILVFTFDINSVQENDFLFTPLIYAFLIDRIRMSEDREREREREREEKRKRDSKQLCYFQSSGSQRTVEKRK